MPNIFETYLSKIKEYQLLWVPEASPDGWVIYGTTADWLLSLTTAWVSIPARVCEKIASDLVVSAGLHCVQPAQFGLNMAEKKDYNWISKFIVPTVQGYRIVISA